MKHTLPEKSTTKLPKKYWFTLILMWIVCILASILLIGNSYAGGQYVDFIKSFSIFALFLIMFYFFQKFLDKIITYLPVIATYIIKYFVFFKIIRR